MDATTRGWSPGWYGGHLSLRVAWDCWTAGWKIRKDDPLRWKNHVLQAHIERMEHRTAHPLPQSGIGRIHVCHHSQVSMVSKPEITCVLSIIT